MGTELVTIIIWKVFIITLDNDLQLNIKNEM